MAPRDIDLSPAFKKIAAHIRERILRQEWRPGELMPGEVQLARDYGVSVGTIRKALDLLNADHLINRRRGKGTVVRRITAERSVLSYFRLVSDDGRWNHPTDRVLGVERAVADEAEVRKLALRAGERVWRVRRVRENDGRPCVFDRFAVPESLFPTFAWPPDIAGVSTAFQYYERRFGILVMDVVDQIKAEVAEEPVARALGLPSPAAVLKVDRIVHAIDGRIIEWRVSWCRTDTMHYRSDLRLVG